ncbi:27795_t:CDS:2, partial [Racocetra persica]
RYNGDAKLGKSFNTFEGKCMMSEAAKLAGDIDSSKIQGSTKITSSSTTIKYVQNINEFCEIFGIKFSCGFNFDALDLSGLNFNLSGSS